MAVGRAARFAELRPRIEAVFGTDPALLDRVERLLTLLELAWHDCYGEVTPPAEVMDDLLLCSRGTLDGLVEAAHVAVIDRRDVHLAAGRLRDR